MGTGSNITVAQTPAAASSDAPRFTHDGKLEFAENYREWIYLTSGLNMSYAPRVSGMAGHDTFDNVFVNPSAYKAFLETGAWPDQTAARVARHLSTSPATSRIPASWDARSI